MTLPPLLVSLLILKDFLQSSLITISGKSYLHLTNRGEEGGEETMDGEVLAFFTWSATYEKQLL